MKKYIFDEQTGKIRGEWIEIEASSAEEAIEKFKKLKEVVEVISYYDTFSTSAINKIFLLKTINNEALKVIATK